MRITNRNIKLKHTEVESIPVTLQRGDMGEHPMAEPDRLGRLEMGKACHEEVDMILGHSGHSADQISKKSVGLASLLPHVQTDIGSHLIIATATCHMNMTKRKLRSPFA